MKASLTYHGEHDPEYDYRTVQYIVSIDGRGIYSAMSRGEADDLIERVNNHPETLAALKEAKKMIARLQKRVKRLTANFNTKAFMKEAREAWSLKPILPEDLRAAIKNEPTFECEKIERRKRKSSFSLRNDGKGSMTIRQSFAPDAPSAGTI